MEGDKFAGSAARALYDFEATTSEDLSFKKGDVIPIIYKGDDGWWHGEHEQKFGECLCPPSHSSSPLVVLFRSTLFIPSSLFASNLI